MERSERERRLAVVEALAAMSVAQRSHYNFKSGFQGDEPRLRNEPRSRGPAEALFAGVGEDERRRLHAGVDAGIAELFAQSVTEYDAVRDGVWAEVRPVVARIMELIR